MNKKSKKTLKNAFNIPELNHKDSFFNKLDIKPERKFSSFIPIYLPTVIVAVMIIGVWSSIKNLPRFEEPENIDNSAYSSESSDYESNTDNYIQTSFSYVRNSEKPAQTTTAVKTDKSSKNKKSTTTKTITTTTKSTKDNSDKRNDEYNENLPSDNIADNDYENNDKKTETTQTTTGKATSTTHRTTITTSTEKSSITTDEQNFTDDEQNLTEPTTTIPNPSSDTPTPQTTTYSPSLDISPDYTVFPPVRYYPDDNAIYLSEFTEDADGLTPPQSGFLRWEDLAQSSDMIVIADVDEIIYTGFDGKPYTQENITVSEVIKGDIEKYSKISVYGKGGYIPACEYSTDINIKLEQAIENNMTIFDPGENKTFSETGKTYLYFIKESESPLPNGSYHLVTYSDISRFCYKDGYYVSMNNNNLMFTIKEIYDFINN